MRKDKNPKKEIINDLLKTGFPLEVSVSNTLNGAKWRVVSSPLYVDPDSGITRELDINALKIYHKNPKDIDSISLFSHLVVGCKKSGNPWVFFDNGEKGLFWIGFYSIKSPKEGFISKLCDDGEAIGFKEHRYKNIKVHRSFHLSFSKPNQTSDIYEALITSCKALEYFKHQYGNNQKTVHIFTPIIVLGGTLWSTSLNKNSKISLKQVDKIVVDFDYLFGNDKTPSKYQNQLIEVVTHKEFKKLLKEVDRDNKALLKGWINFLSL